MYRETIFDFKPKSAQDWILLLGAAGISIIAPHAGAKLLIGEIKQYIKNHSEKPVEINNKNLSKALHQMKKRKIISVNQENGMVVITLTEKGLKRKLQLDLEQLKSRKFNNWDGKWRMVVFDIPEGLRAQRKLFRERLKYIGFIQFQKSVWLYPYDCRAEVDLLAISLNIAQHLTFFTADIDDDGPLRSKFSLPSFRSDRP